MTKRTTITDIAREVGVSAMTVSKALNGKPGISEAMRLRVLDAASRMNYMPNLIAKSLRGEGTHTLGVVLSDSSEMVTSKVLRGIEDAAARNGYNVILSNTGHDPAVESRSVELLIKKRIEGLILVAPLCSTRGDTQRIMGYQTPAVFLMRLAPFGSFDAVVNDNLLGGYRMAKHLLETGGRAFAFVHLRRSSQSGRYRIRGYRKAFAEHGMEYGAQPAFFSGPFIEEGYENTMRLIQSGARFDTLVCGCDLIAIGAIEALCESGLSVPGDVRVSGYDDIELAKYLRVPLTTVHQPLYTIGFRGVETLLARIREPGAPVRKIVLESELVVRESTQST